MSALAVLSLFLVISSGLSRPEKTHIEPQNLDILEENGQYELLAEENEPQYLDMLVATGQYELFAKAMNVPVDLVRPNEDMKYAKNEDPVFDEDIEFDDIIPSFDELDEESRQGWNFTVSTRYKWPNQYIPYYIGNSFTETEKETIEDSIKSWNDQVKCLKLRPRKDEKDYVYVVNGERCRSQVGNMKNGSQYLTLQSSRGCVRKRTVLHEFEHAAGIRHEHNRSDRDDYVEVLWDNIPKESHGQYNKSDSYWYGLQGHYDYYSLMHYRVKLSSNKDAFRIKKSGIDINRIGRATDFTKTDIDKINTLYC